MFRPNWPAAVLWDLDGTLIDSEPYWMQSERDFAGKYGSDWTDTDGLKLVGLSLEESSRILKEKTGAEVHSSEVIEHLTNGVVAQLNEKIHWRPGAQQLLRALKRRRIKTVLQELMGKAARMISHAGQWALGLGRNDGAFEVFALHYGQLRGA